MTGRLVAIVQRRRLRSFRIATRTRGTILYFCFHLSFVGTHLVRLFGALVIGVDLGVDVQFVGNEIDVLFEEHVFNALTSTLTPLCRSSDDRPDGPMTRWQKTIMMRMARPMNSMHVMTLKPSHRPI